MAKQDPSCADVANRISAIVFLATPHRGSDYATYLNNLLRVSAAHTSRKFVASLKKSSTILARINDTFRHYCNDLILYSFFETEPLKLSLGGSNLIVNKDSAIIGSPSERVSLMNANHRTICKFNSPVDPNYLALADAFSSINRELSNRLGMFSTLLVPSE
jgi:hypothetical protein